MEHKLTFYPQYLFLDIYGPASCLELARWKKNCHLKTKEKIKYAANLNWG